MLIETTCPEWRALSNLAADYAISRSAKANRIPPSLVAHIFLQKVPKQNGTHCPDIGC
jgi:hypothetical protein